MAWCGTITALVAQSQQSPPQQRSSPSSSLQQLLERVGISQRDLINATYAMATPQSSHLLAPAITAQLAVASRWRAAAAATATTTATVAAVNGDDNIEIRQ